MPFPIASRRSLMRGLFLMPFAGRATAVQAAIARPAVSGAQGTCTLFPRAVEGPYYFDPKLVRSDIADGKAGRAIELYLRVIEQGPCVPLANLRVDIWHADAAGIYSGYARQGDERTISTKGQTYLRGTQFTKEDGTVLFRTIYPGWYPGRTPHVHVKIFLDTTTLVTGQIYFPDALSARIYGSHEAYTGRGAADTTNDADFIFRGGMADGGGIVFTMGEDAEPLRATLVIGVDRSGEAGRAKKGPGAGWRKRLGF